MIENPWNKEKPKVELVILLDEEGNVGVKCSSKNLLTIFGMMEMAKKAYLENGIKAQLQPPSPIHTLN